eukprot:scpid92944/ scgid3349/ Leucine-rich repeat-containing protein 69
MHNANICSAVRSKSVRVFVYVFRKRASHFIKTKDPILYQALAAASECSVCQRNFLSICIECVMFVSIKKVFPETRKSGQIPMQALLCSHKCFQEQRSENQYYGLLQLPPPI